MAVTRLFFFVALDEFNVLSTEGKGDTTKLSEALQTWKEVITSPYAQRVGVMLFLNKVDLLEKKLKDKHSLREFEKEFPKYKGGKDLKAAVDHVRDYFMEVVPDAMETEQIEVVVTCALDRELMQKVFVLVTEHILTTRIRLSKA